MAEIDANALNSLAEKIESLDLTESEQAVIDGLLERAAAYEPEVEGFGLTTNYSGLTSGADLSATAFKFGSALNLIGSPGSMMDFGGGGTRPPPP
jgi:hypothetical protein